MARKLAILCLALAMVVVFGWLDYLTGEDVRSALFYVIPIVFVAWSIERRYVVLIALSSGVAWGLAEASVHGAELNLVSTWNETAALVLFLVVGLAIATLRRERDQLKAANSRIHDLLDLEERISRTDVLTGLPNSREFMERLTPEVARCHRDNKPLCLLYLDLDNFKRVNDRFGHLAGDEVLKRVAEALRKQLRASDVPARLGGDEFAALLWQTSAEGAAQIGQRMVDAVVEIGSDYAGSELGASIGVVWYDNPPSDVKEVVKRADNAMYDAKKSGKRRTVVIKADALANAKDAPAA
ncbi:MAG: diguanylate cyclase [Planctomycetes bacterium]|nr:diguanylate cyclase [Planctomycetota bacterium]